MQRRRRRRPATNGSPVIDEPTTSSASITPDLTRRLTECPMDQIERDYFHQQMNSRPRQWSNSFNFPKLSLLQSVCLIILFLSTNLCHGNFLIICCQCFLKSLALERVHEFQRFDGWYNNLANPQWGSVGSRLHRDAPSNYEDGVYKMQSNLPSARAISGKFMGFLKK